MDAKVTLSFDAEVIERAKILCDELGISLSRFTEIVYSKALEFGRPASIEELPVSAWVNAVAEDGRGMLYRMSVTPVEHVSRVGCVLSVSLGRYDSSWQRSAPQGHQRQNNTQRDSDCH